MICDLCWVEDMPLHIVSNMLINESCIYLCPTCYRDYCAWRTLDNLFNN